MPSFLDKIKNRRNKGSENAREKEAQGQEDEVSGQTPVPGLTLSRESSDSLDNPPFRLHIPPRDTDEKNHHAAPRTGDNANLTVKSDHEPRTPTSQLPNPIDEHRSAQIGTNLTPPLSNEKRLSRRLLNTLTRRPSIMSHRSRSSSHVPDFEPIDHNNDVEAQWEQRATLLARAGPPSPAIPRSDSVFDLGPPRLPPVVFDTTSQSLLPSAAGNRLSSAPDVLQTSPRKGSSLRQASSPSKHTGETSLATSSIPESGNDTHDAAGGGQQSRDDILQSAILEHERGNLEIATQLFKRSAQGEDGLPIGQLMYGLSLRHGWGTERDEARAIHWLRLAAASSAAVEEAALASGLVGGGEMKGDLRLAIFELGNCFRFGWGVEQDKALARAYYETAANLQDSDAMNEIAWCFETGFGTKRDKYKAAYWYRASERAGNVVPGMQWIWKKKYDPDPFTTTDSKRK